MADDRTHMDKISEIIGELSKDAAFSADAMAQFVELKAECDSQASTIRYLRNDNKSKQEEIDGLKESCKEKDAEISRLSLIEGGWIQREIELEDREGQQVELRTRLELQEQRVADHQHMFGMVFRNIEIRRSTMGERGLPQPDGGWAPQASLEEKETSE